MDNEKKPRHYAAEICALTPQEKRREALEKVPEQYRAITKSHVVNYFFVKKHRR